VQSVADELAAAESVSTSADCRRECLRSVQSVADEIAPAESVFAAPPPDWRSQFGAVLGHPAGFFTCYLYGLYCGESGKLNLPLGYI